MSDAKLLTLVKDALQAHAVCSHCGHEGALEAPNDLARVMIETVLESYEVSGSQWDHLMHKSKGAK